MKRIAINTLVTFLILYLSFGFVGMEFDVTKWSRDTRFFYIIFSLALSILSLVFSEDFIDKNN